MGHLIKGFFSWLRPVSFIFLHRFYFPTFASLSPSSPYSFWIVGTQQSMVWIPASNNSAFLYCQALGSSSPAFSQTGSSCIILLKFFPHILWTLGKTNKNCLFSFHFPRHFNIFFFHLILPGKPKRTNKIDISSFW